jgi:hypothetical protein
MTQRSPQPRAASRCAYWRFCCLGLCVTAITLSGCAAEQKTKARTFPWALATSARPLLPKAVASQDFVVDDSWLQADLDIPPPPSPLASVPNIPQRPRVVAATSGPSTQSRPEPPQIVPQLTAEETTAAQQQTSLSLSVAEHNIAVSRGRSLNAMQSDLASKVRSFVTEAREAAHVGDWTRASNAAKKAQVLSEELAGSL